MILILILSLLVITSILFIVQLLLYKSQIILGSQADPLEAGFESLLIGYALSSPFLFLAVLFVLFDLELLLLLPGVIFHATHRECARYTWLVLIGLVLLTLLFEWSVCGLKWHI